MNQISPIQLPAVELSPVEMLVREIADTIAAGLPSEAIGPETSNRERFMELLVLALGNLFGKTPVPASPFSRTMMKTITEGMDDNDAGAFSTRADDWIRLEGMVRVQEGQKNYTLNRMSISVLSTPTSQGSVGEVMEQVLKVYIEAGPSLRLRQVTRRFGAYFMTRLGRGG